MSILQVSERIIKENFCTLEEKTNKNISHNESNLYYNDNLVYKIFKPVFRLDKEKNMYLIYGKKFPFANNIVDKLYQGEKLIGITCDYLENFISMYDYMNSLQLYDIKIIMSELLLFHKRTIESNLIYWDNHLNNMGMSQNKFYIVDIDSMTKITNKNDVYFALNGLLALFYEMYYKIPIRNIYDNYRGIISLLSENENYTSCQLTLNDIKRILDNSTVDYLESKRKVLDLKKI